LAAVLASEAIVVTDIVGATERSGRYGFERVGRTLARDLRKHMETIGNSHGMTCIKSTGDGCLTAYRNASASAVGVVDAVKASFELLDRLAAYNQDSPPEFAINIRVAIHFGQVESVQNDREGLPVSFAFRLEQLRPRKAPSPIGAFSDFIPLTPERFPEQNYILGSEIVVDILREQKYGVSICFVGLFKFKGFPGWQEVYLLSR